MSPGITLIFIFTLAGLAFTIGKKRAFSMAGGSEQLRNLHSRPHYYGWMTALGCGVPALILFCAWQIFSTPLITQIVTSSLPQTIRDLPSDQLALIVHDIQNLATGKMVAGELTPFLEQAAEHYRNITSISGYCLLAMSLSVLILVMLFIRRRMTDQTRARNRVEKWLLWILVICSTLAILTTVGIIFSVLFEAIRFFKAIPALSFLFGTEWSPQMAIRADQVGGSGSFGAIPVFTGTMMISGIAMMVAVPIGLMSAIYLSEYAGSTLRAWGKPLMELLAGIPTVVYGFFAALVVAPALRNLGASIGLSVSSESALAAGLVMGVMIIPFVSSLSDDVINAVPQSLRDGAYGLGATKSETLKHVIIPAALPGIVGGVLLALSRAIGETMIVVMAAGLSANLTANPLQAVTTVTVQIVTLLVGDQEFDSPKTLAAFALGLMLFISTLCLNIVALYIVRKYREQYE